MWSSREMSERKENTRTTKGGSGLVRPTLRGSSAPAPSRLAPSEPGPRRGLQPRRSIPVSQGHLNWGHRGCGRYKKVAGPGERAVELAGFWRSLPPILLAGKPGASAPHLLRAFPHWPMGTSRWIRAQRRQGTMLESHSTRPSLGHGGRFVCFWPQPSNRFDWSSRLESIQDSAGS